MPRISLLVAFGLMSTLVVLCQAQKGGGKDGKDGKDGPFWMTEAGMDKKAAEWGVSKCWNWVKQEVFPDGYSPMKALSAYPKLQELGSKIMQKGNPCAQLMEMMDISKMMG